MCVDIIVLFAAQAIFPHKKKINCYLHFPHLNDINRCKTRPALLIDMSEMSTELLIRFMNYSAKLYYLIILYVLQDEILYIHFLLLGQVFLVANLL